MRCFVVLFIGLLAEMSFASKCCSKDTLDINVLRSGYQRTIDCILVPTIEYGDRSAEKFKTEGFKSIADYGVDLLTSVHSQAWDAGNELIDDIQRDKCKIQKSIELITSSSARPICLEKHLKRTTDHLRRFLKLKPGNGEPEPTVLPEFPPEQVKLVSRTTKRTAEEAFLNIESTLYSNTLQMYAYMTYAFRISVIESKSLYETIRTKFYNEIINCPVMGNYTKAVKEIYRHCRLIRSNVSPETWKSFKEAGDRVVEISADYCRSLKDGKD